MTREELASAGFAVSVAVHAQLARFVSLMLEENRQVNLTAIRDPADVWAVHICDSLAVVPLVEAARARRLVDVGTGGGVPGVPLACACEHVEVTLIDATRKKVAAVQRIAQGLRLANVRAVWGRAEDLGRQPAYRETFDGVTVRAVADLPIAMEYAAGLVRPGGRCWFYRSVPQAENDVRDAARAARDYALAYLETCRYTLPGGHGTRALLTYQKRGRLRPDLPRPATHRH